MHTLKPTPDPGSVFSGWFWTGDIDCFDDVVTMDKDKNCTAIFHLFPKRHVVDKNYPTSTCTTGDYYYSKIQDAADAIMDSNSWGDTITVCPGTYVENVSARRGVTIESYSQNPLDTIVQAADPDKNTFEVRGNQTNPSISGFTITGATGEICNIDGSDIPCAGIRVYCAGYNSIISKINNNIIVGNNTGIYMKDTADDWVFNYDIYNNVIIENNVGVTLHYGHYMTVRDNNISDNLISGVKLIDTWGNTITNNTIKYNGLGFELGSDIYSRGYATRNNIIYHNKLINNNLENYPLESQVSDNASCPTIIDSYVYEHYWYEPLYYILEGNFWSDYYGDDDGSGRGKHAIAGDHIGDTDIPHPYPDDPNECFDGYPFMYSDAWLCSNLPVRIPETAFDYYTLQDAYDDAADGHTIKARSTDIPGDLDFNRPISVTLEGGYSCDYGSVIGITTLNGTMTISDGTVTIGDGTFLMG